MKIPPIKLMPLLLLGVWLGSGCAPPLYYKDMVAPATFKGSGAATVAVQDRREYVTSGKIDPSYEGQVRATVGIPYHRSTVTGAPLAAEMARAVATTLTNQGYAVTVLGAAPADPEKEVQDRLISNKPVRALHLLINEWMYDGWGSYKLESKLTLKVMDGEGKELVIAEHAQQEELGGHPQNPAKEAFRRRLVALMSKPEVIEAMNMEGAAPAPTAAPEPAPEGEPRTEGEPEAVEDPDKKEPEVDPAAKKEDPDRKEPEAQPAEDDAAKNRTAAPPATE